jgi:hypothetical protein
MWVCMIESRAVGLGEQVTRKSILILYLAFVDYQVKSPSEFTPLPYASGNATSTCSSFPSQTTTALRVYPTSGPTTF